MMKCNIVLMLAMLVTMSALGQRNCIYIEDFDVSPDSTVTVPVILANQDTTYGIQFTLKAPAGLKVKSVKKTAYSDKIGMELTTSKRDDSRIVLVYSLEMKAFPPDTVAVLDVKFHAEPGFRGGDIAIVQCFGAKYDTEGLAMDGGTTHVTLPDGALFGLPENAPSTGDGFFDQQGQP